MCAHWVGTSVPGWECIGAFSLHISLALVWRFRFCPLQLSEYSSAWFRSGPLFVGSFSRSDLRRYSYFSYFSFFHVILLSPKLQWSSFVFDSYTLDSWSLLHTPGNRLEGKSHHILYYSVFNTFSGSKFAHTHMWDISPSPFFLHLVYFQCIHWGLIASFMHNTFCRFYGGVQKFNHLDKNVWLLHHWIGQSLLASRRRFQAELCKVVVGRSAAYLLTLTTSTVCVMTWKKELFLIGDQYFVPITTM